MTHVTEAYYTDSIREAGENAALMFRVAPDALEYNYIRYILCPSVIFKCIIILHPTFGNGICTEKCFPQCSLFWKVTEVMGNIFYHSST